MYYYAHIAQLVPGATAEQSHSNLDRCGAAARQSPSSFGQLRVIHGDTLPGRGFLGKSVFVITFSKIPADIRARRM
jgi:hypothetical protein